MTIRLRCPRGHKLTVPDDLAGKKGRCPVCQERVRIPRSDGSESIGGSSEQADSNDDDDPAAPSIPPPVPGSAKTLREQGYRADPGKVQTTYLLAVALGALTLLCAAPAVRHINLLEAPNWARVVLVASALQLIFICWMVSLPDWSTVWVGMVVFALVASLYGIAWAVITFTPDYMPVNFLDLDEPPDDPIRRRAGPWCFVMLMLATLLTYACGRFSGRWRKQYEMAKALRE